MEEQKFEFEDDGCIKGVVGETTITKQFFNLPCGQVSILITEQQKDNNGEEYYNVYIINEHFKIDPMNCLHLQEPKEITKEPESYFNEKYCEFKAIENYLWFKYGNPDKETVLSFSIEEHN